METLKPEELRWICPPEKFPFSTTADAPLLKGVIGQERARRSLDFGLGVLDHGYNLYVLGESGTGRTSIVRARLEEKAKKEEVPPDLCYVYNFFDPDKPKAMTLPPGKGAEIRQDMDELVETLRRDIPKVFESKDYERHRDELIEGQQERTKAIFYRLEQKAVEMGFVLKKTVSGLAVVSATKDGKPMSQDEFNRLAREKRAELEEKSRFLQDRLGDAIREARSVEKETQERINALDREVVQYVVNPLMNELFEKYREFAGVSDYLNDVREDIFKSIEDFRPKEEMQLPLGLKIPRPEPTFERYRVNLFVSNAETKGAPVVVETNPTYYNLFGRIEHKIQYGVAATDFTMIKAGSVQRANGGYLVVDALDLLRNIFVYDALKRMIKTAEARVEDVWEQYRLISTTTLKPSPIPVKIKIVLIGEPWLYYLLYNLDTEYKKLFKVKADFDNTLDKTDENISLYAEFVGSRCKEKSLLPFDRTAVAKVVEYGARVAGDKEKLTARFSAVENLLIEASYWAALEGRAAVLAEDVEKADRERIFRNSKIEEKIREFIKEDTIMVSTAGEVVGQVNGIAVLDFGDYAFGKPSRITARVFMGDEGVVSIEREVKMSGRIHNKAQMILKNFLGERFARDFPLTLSASVCFEQLYEEVEGDSATLTELYALISSISELPIKQGIAVTGSMNQLGEVQPVGGVNEKIEGFFDVCAEKGLRGGEGVIMPKRNVKNLMLRKELAEAVGKGVFSIYPIETVDEGLEILLGRPVGARAPDGKFPEGTVNRLIEERLSTLARGLKEFGKKPPKAEKE
jgi:lon-related putative ATP-dependent protease